MTDESRTQSGDGGETRQRWIRDLQEALDKTGDAVRTAWEATRDSRMGALESAKQAAKELGDVLEKGMEAAKERWGAEEGARESDTTMPATGETAPPVTPVAPPPPEPPAQAPPGDVPPADMPPPDEPNQP